MLQSRYRILRWGQRRSAVQAGARRGGEEGVCPHRGHQVRRANGGGRAVKQSQIIRKTLLPYLSRGTGIRGNCGGLENPTHYVRIKLFLKWIRVRYAVVKESSMHQRHHVQTYIDDDDLCFARPPDESALLSHARSNPEDDPEEVEPEEEEGRDRRRRGGGGQEVGGGGRPLEPDHLVGKSIVGSGGARSLLWKERFVELCSTLSTCWKKSFLKTLQVIFNLGEKCKVFSVTKIELPTVIRIWEIDHERRFCFISDSLADEDGTKKREDRDDSHSSEEEEEEEEDDHSESDEDEFVSE